MVSSDSKENVNSSHAKLNKAGRRCHQW